MPSIIIKSGTPPTATPDELEVSPDQDFEFEGDVAFTIKFTEDSPDKNDPDKKKRKSSKENGKDKIKMKAKDVKKRYPYEIVIGDSSADPAIIIK